MTFSKKVKKLSNADEAIEKNNKDFEWVSPKIIFNRIDPDNFYESGEELQNSDSEVRSPSSNF